MPARKTPPSAEPLPGKSPGKKRVVFTWPEAAAAEVAGSFSEWQLLPLKKNATGALERIMYLLPGAYEYRFLVDGSWCSDPACTEQTLNPFGSLNSVLRVS